MSMRVIFDEIKPILDEYISQKNTLQKQITSEGTLPPEIISACPVHSILEIKKFDDDILESSSDFLNWIKDNEIIDIESDKHEICFQSTKEKVEGIKGKDPNEGFRMPADMSLKERRIEYGFRFLLPKLKKKSFYQILNQWQFYGISTCRHFAYSEPDGFPAIITRKDDRHIVDLSRSLVNSLHDKEVITELELLCKDCYKRIDKLCCRDAIIQNGITYSESNHYPTFDQIILKSVLSKKGMEFNEINHETGFRGSFLEFYFPKRKTVLTFKHRELDNTIGKLKPEVIIIQGKKEDVVDFLKYDSNLIIFDDAENVTQRYYLFDKSKEVETNIEKCCLHIIENLESYSNEIRGKEADKIIEALVRIGRELGFIPEREFGNKGARLDAVWLDRDGSVFGALEVETSSQWKKDVVTTWETEPKLAVIVSHYKTEKGIKDILQYVLLKTMPHKLLFINNESKKGYLIEKQSVLRYYDLIKKKEVSESEVFEY